MYRLVILLMIMGSLSRPSIFFLNKSHSIDSRNTNKTWGDTLSYDFKFINSGDEDLKIISVNSSCSCTAAYLSSKTLHPNDTGLIRLETTYDMLYNLKTVYAVIESNTFEKYSKIKLSMK